MRVEAGPIVGVLGGINVDLVVSGASLPRAGETVTGGVFAEHQGGKGGNQAVAAARAMQYGRMLTGGGHTYGFTLAGRGHIHPGIWMLGAVGDDQLGVRALEALRTEDVQTDHVLVTADSPTGVALIAVGPDGENQISVAPGANAALTAAHVVNALETLRPHLLLASLEVSQPSAHAAVAWCHDHEVPVVLNPAPLRGWARELLALATYVTPNAHELEGLGDIPDDVVVIETRGAAGARIHRNGAIVDVAAQQVVAIDTTGAGDCFNGVLAARLSEGRDLMDAVRDGVVAAALSVQIAGAREGMPDAGALADARARFFG